MEFSRQEYWSGLPFPAHFYMEGLCYSEPSFHIEIGFPDTGSGEMTQPLTSSTNRDVGFCFFFFLLKNNCFTEFCFFLSNLSVNQS